MEKLFEIIDLHVSVEGKPVLKGVSLSIYKGDLIALLGPNGNGKTTLFMAIMGHPKYRIEKGDILFNGLSIIDLTPDERAKLGIFYAFQNPVEVPGVINADFLKTALNIKEKKPVSFVKFYHEMNESVSRLQMPLEMTKRSLNVGFSGGEKKKNEILQMLLLNPSLSLVDEIDSGLDVDALNLISEIIKTEHEKQKTFVVISHNSRFFEIVKPNRVIVIIDGLIQVDAGPEMLEVISQNGFASFEGVANHQISSLGLCGVKKGEH
ncbi:MAG: Fe-S cluster assembly ATPase SufC [Erysipelotrichaceae bacterium]|jgi:Fe-S cluster assembly ATP-binding protein|nr:Fe-S cluster assembly ATPase SufC [Erysipelotrichaceae bacterium]